MGEVAGDTAVVGDSGVSEIDQLKNDLRLEKAKNEVLVGDVVALEDALVNRDMVDFDSVLSEETKPFWRGQLLANRADALKALTDLVRVKTVGPAGGAGTACAAGGDTVRRPIHNRETARPALSVVGGGGASLAGEDRAAKVRNRAHELVVARGLAFSAAFRCAEREVAG